MHYTVRIEVVRTVHECSTVGVRMSRSSEDATQSLAAHAIGDQGAADRLFPLVYDNLRALARKYLNDERPDHTLEPTALVHEAYLRMIDVDRIDWRGESHFMAMAARQMRRILVEHARKRKATKRGGEWTRITLNTGDATIAPAVDVLAVHDALEKLAELSPRQSEVAMLRFFGGLKEREAALVLGVSERTVREDWSMARAWLARELRSGPEP